MFKKLSLKKFWAWLKHEAGHVWSAVLAWFGVVGIYIATDFQAAVNWGLKEWAKRAAVATVFGFLTGRLHQAVTRSGPTDAPKT